MLQEEVDALNRKFKRDYGYELDSFEILWPHLLGRLKKEIDQKAFSVIALTRCGSEAEGGRNPTTKQWSTAPGVITVVGGDGWQTAVHREQPPHVGLVGYAAGCLLSSGQLSDPCRS